MNEDTKTTLVIIFLVLMCISPLVFSKVTQWYAESLKYFHYELVYEDIQYRHGIEMGLLENYTYVCNYSKNETYPVIFDYTHIHSETTILPKKGSCDLFKKIPINQFWEFFYPNQALGPNQNPRLKINNMSIYYINGN